MLVTEQESHRVRPTEVLLPGSVLHILKAAGWEARTQLEGHSQNLKSDGNEQEHFKCIYLSSSLSMCRHFSMAMCMCAEALRLMPLPPPFTPSLPLPDPLPA